MVINKTALKVELVKRGWTLASLADALGYRPSTLSSWVSGRYSGPTQLLTQIANALDVEPSVLNCDATGRRAKS